MYYRTKLPLECAWDTSEEFDRKYFGKGFGNLTREELKDKNYSRVFEYFIPLDEGRGEASMKTIQIQLDRDSYRETRILKLSTSLTGWKYEQVLQLNKPEIFVHPIRLDGEFFGIPILEINAVALNPSIGIKREIELLQKFSELYRNADLGITGQAITESIYRVLPDCLKEYYYNCFISTLDTEDSNSLVYVNYKGEIDYWRESFRWYEPCLMCDFCPVIPLPHDILVEYGYARDGYSSETPLKLYKP